VLVSEDWKVFNMLVKTF